MDEETKPKRTAKDNPWYRLATFHGEPARFDDEVVVKNRVTWNRWMASRMSDDLRAALLKKGHTPEELEPPTFSGKANFSGATFSRSTHFIGATFSGTADFDSATFSDYAYFNSATCSGSDVASFRSTTFSGWRQHTSPDRRPAGRQPVRRGQ